MKDRFETVVACLLKAEPSCLKGLDFEDLCRSSNSSPRRLNNCFYDTFGMSGEEFIIRLCASGLIADRSVA